MVAILKHLGTTDWDVERLNMSVNTPASWSAHAVRTWLGMPSGPAALRGLTRLNVLQRRRVRGVQSLLAGSYGGTILSSKREKKVFSLSGSVTLVYLTWLVFFL